MYFRLKHLFIGSILLLLVWSQKAIADHNPSRENITIVVSGSHDFNNAGIYAAIEKGLFTKKGIVVEITGSNNFNESISGENFYGFGDAGWVISNQEKFDLVLLSQIYQQSPRVIVTKSKSGIMSPFELARKKILVDTGDPVNAAILSLINETVSGEVNYSNQYISFDILNKFIANEVDALVVDLTDELFELQQQGIKTNIIYPAHFGLNFYGNCLFTTNTNAKKYSEQCKLVIGIIMEGWRYALNNEKELVNVIQKKYNSEITNEKLLYQAQIIKTLISHQLIELGKVNKNRYQMMANHYFDLDFRTSNLPKHFFFGQLQQHYSTINLTDKEQLWLEKKDTIKLGFPSYYEPVLYTDSMAKLEGMLVDFARLFEKRLNSNIKIIAEDWDDLYKKIEEKEIDGYLLAAESRIVEANLKTTASYYSTYITMFTKKNSGISINKWSDLEGLKVIYPKSSRFIRDYFSDNNKKIELNKAENMYQALLMVNNNEVDVAVGDLLDLYFINKCRFNNLKVSYIYNREPFNGKMGIRSDLIQLVPILNKAIESVSQQEIDSIYDKYIKIEQAWDNDLHLSHIEKLWLLEHPVIRIASDPVWEPLEFLDKDNLYQGISIDYLSIIEEKLRINFEHVPEKSWSVLYEKAKNKEIDLLSSATLTPERLSYFSFTKPYAELPNYIFAREKTNNVNSLSDISGQKVALVKDYYSAEFISSNYPEIELVLANDVEEAIRLVKNGTVPYFIENITIGNYYLQKMNVKNIKVVGSVSRSYNLCMAVRNDWEIFADILQKTIDAIPPSEKDNIYHKWTTIKNEQSFDYSLLLKIILPLLFLLTLIIIWNRMLAREMRKRKQAQQELNAAFDQLKNTQTQLIQNEKMASVGLLTAGIIHEIKNPMNFINYGVFGFQEIITTLLNKLNGNKTVEINRDKILEEYNKLSEAVEDGMTRTIEIINSLGSFSRIGNEKIKVDLHQNIDSTLILLRSQYKYDIEIIKEYGKIPDIECNPGKLNQVFMNLLANAIHAINGKGHIWIKTYVEGNYVKISIKDDGNGIGEEHLKEIFKPFFTTKPIGKGTGLGLAISNNIIGEHKGKIEVSSFVGKGTEFIINLPLNIERQA